MKIKNIVFALVTVLTFLVIGCSSSTQDRSVSEINSVFPLNTNQHIEGGGVTFNVILG